MEVERYGTAADVERVTGGLIPRLRAYQLARENVLPPGVVLRLGRQIRFDLHRLEDWLESGGAGFDGGWRRRRR
jgi:hypothetical protein